MKYLKDIIAKKQQEAEVQPVPDLMELRREFRTDLPRDDELDGPIRRSRPMAYEGEITEEDASEDEAFEAFEDDYDDYALDDPDSFDQFEESREYEPAIPVVEPERHVPPRTVIEDDNPAETEAALLRISQQMAIEKSYYVEDDDDDEEEVERPWRLEHGAARVATVEDRAERPPLRAVETAPEPMPPSDFQMPAPAMGRGGPRAGRVKTRLLGFEQGGPMGRDLMTAGDSPAVAAPKSDAQFPVGWLVVVKGPGRGASFPITFGVSQIGRGEDQAIALSFGDTSISRSNHAAVAYDEEAHRFYLGHGGKSNLVRLNGRPVLTTEEMSHGDVIRIGETTLRFAALCDDTFHWGAEGDHDGHSQTRA